MTLDLTKYSEVVAGTSPLHKSNYNGQDAQQQANTAYLNDPSQLYAHKAKQCD